MVKANHKIIEKLIGRGMEVQYQTEWYDAPGGRAERTLERINGIHAPLTSQEWCSLCMRDGRDYMGGCCGNTGVVQDILNGIFRDSGNVDSYTALYLWESAAHHEGFELIYEKDEEKLLEAEADWENLLPIDKLFLCVAAARPMMHPLVETAHAVNEENVKDIISVLASGIALLKYKDLFGNHPLMKEGQGQSHGNTALTVARMVPAARAFLEHIKEIGMLPFEGFAIVDDKNQVMENRMGYTVYVKREHAQEMVDLWQKDDKDGEAKKLAIKPVKVTVEKGFEIIE